MNKFWTKRGQTQQNDVPAPNAYEQSPKPRSVKAVRKPGCWGGSRAAGEPEVVCSPSADKIKVRSGHWRTVTQIPHHQHNTFRNVVQLSTMCIMVRVSPVQYTKHQCSVMTLQAVRPDCTPQPVSHGTANRTAYSWNPFVKDKALPAPGGAVALQQLLQYTLSFNAVVLHGKVALLQCFAVCEPGATAFMCVKRM